MQIKLQDVGWCTKLVFQEIMFFLRSEWHAESYVGAASRIDNSDESCMSKYLQMVVLHREKINVCCF
jgi:hypothetical protein